jgi:hypothetical protein
MTESTLAGLVDLENYIYCINELNYKYIETTFLKFNIQNEIKEAIKR